MLFIVISNEVLPQKCTSYFAILQQLDELCLTNDTDKMIFSKYKLNNVLYSIMKEVFFWFVCALR